jgi:pilus assembly protein CpaB
MPGRRIMITRIILFVVMALGLFGFGAVTWISSRPHGPGAGQAAAAPAEMRVLVAARALRPGSLLAADDVTMSALQIDTVPPNAMQGGVTKPADLVGTMLRRGLRTGEPLLQGDVLHPADRGFLAAVLAPGKRAISVAVDVVTGAAGLIWPGDHVDVLLTQNVDDATRPPGQRVAAHTVLNDIRVIAIDQKLVEGATPEGANSKPAATVTLEVAAEQAERVVVAGRIGRLSLVVRAAEAGTEIEAPNHVTWAGDVSPALGTQPAPRQSTTIRVYRGSTDAKEFRF